MVLSEIFPNGASDKQLQKLRDSWFEKFGNPFTDGIKWSDEIELMDREISALGMLSSCFAYGGIKNFYKEGRPCRFNSTGTYYGDYLRDYLELGGTKAEFDKMIDIQSKHLKKCSVLNGVYTDFEGCSYNSINDFDEESLLA